MRRFFSSFVPLVIVLGFAALCLFGYVRAEAALLCGVIFAFFGGGDVLGAQGSKLAKQCLALSIIGMGAGMQVQSVVDAGAAALVLSAVGIVFVFALGAGLARVFRMRGTLSQLICVGTAICGGSAIAAAAPVLKAHDGDVAVALGVVFVLNAFALFIFPVVGHAVGLQQAEFGLWAAMAIHDTSSVVGAGLAYGAEALDVATTTKLVRALWIVPVVMALPMILKIDRGVGGVDADQPQPAVKIPWFIVGFVAAVILVSIFPSLQAGGDMVSDYAKRLLVFTLFLIGAGLNRRALALVGATPFVFGIALWVITSLFSLGVVLALRAF